MTTPLPFAAGPRGEPGWPGQVRRHAHLRPENIALRSLDESRTYAELDHEVDAFVAALDNEGVRRGDRVVVLMGNSIEMVEVLLAVLRLGAVAVPVNFRLVADEVAFLVADSEAVLIVTDAERAPVAAAVRRREGSLPCWVRPPSSERIGRTSAETVAGPGARWLDDPRQGGGEPRLGESPGWDEPCLIMYTSGTTGRPKGAVLTHFNLFCQAFHYVVSAGFVDDSAVTMISVPVFHIAAIGGIVPAMTLGGTVVVMPSGPFDPAELVAVVEREGVTDMFLVPTQWQSVCAVPGLATRRLRLRSIGWGASPTTTTILEAMGRAFPDARIVALFGQTEMAPVTCALRPEDSIRKLGSVGRPVPLVDVRIVNDRMEDVPEGDVGEIVYRGPNLMAGYWKQPEATAEALAGGWFHSGDLVRRDEEGYIYVVDRKKDMIVTGGENVYSAEIEQVLVAHPQIADVAVVGAPHPQWLETPVAFVVATRPDDPPSPAEVLEWTRDRMASYKRPTEVFVLDELPRNASGKVLKNELRADLAARRHRRNEAL